MAQDISILLTD